MLRLLQLPAAVREAAADTLRRTGKARALQVLEQEPAVSDRAAKARTLVDGLNQIEREDAARAEAGAPRWLPLPAVAGGPLRDARMFLVRSHTDGEARAGADAQAAWSAFTVVLLLDFTRLGAVRADLTLAGESLQATVTVAAEASLRLLRRAAADLERRWTDSGLSVQSLQLRLAPLGRLPVADLVAPPRTGDPQAVVDVHA